MRSLFRFPNPVNEVAARTVAAGVVVMAVVALAFDVPWLLIPIAYGFWARVLTGPTLSPLGPSNSRQQGCGVASSRFSLRMMPGWPTTSSRVFG